MTVAHSRFHAPVLPRLVLRPGARALIRRFDLARPQSPRPLQRHAQQARAGPGPLTPCPTADPRRTRREGLDPVANEQMLESIVEAAGEGAAVFFSTHQVSKWSGSRTMSSSSAPGGSCFKGRSKTCAPTAAAFTPCFPDARRWKTCVFRESHRQRQPEPPLAARRRQPGSIERRRRATWAPSQWFWNRSTFVARSSSRTVAEEP